jgi:hemolysin activation/secretion protein
VGFSRRDGQPLEALEATGLPSIIQEFIQELGLQEGLQELGLFTSEGTDERTSVFRFGLDYVSRDVQGVWAWRSQFNLGTGVLDATVREEPFADSRFFSWLFQLQRVQRLGADNLLLVIADLQLTPDSLLPSEQFIIGGGQSLRGYRQNVRFGDNGFRISIEDRIALQKDENGVPTFQLAPFVDLGKVWNNPDNPVPLPAQTFLAGVGVGLLWDPDSVLSIRLDFTVPLVNLDDRGTNAQDDGIYFSVILRP